MLFTIDQYDNQHIFLIYGRELRWSRQYEEVTAFCKAFKEKKWRNNEAEGSGWVIPLTTVSLNHITSNYQADIDYTMTAGARLMLTYLKLTTAVDAAKAEKQWAYVFDGKDTDYTYPSMRKPFAHQRLATEMMHRSEYFGCLMEMGTGKSKCIVDDLDSFNNEMANGEMMRALIVCPKSLRENWRREFMLNMGDMHHIEIGIIDGQANGVDIILQLIQSPARMKIAIASYDSIRNITKEIMLFMPMYLALDESHYIKNPDSKRFKGLNEIANSNTVVMKRILTGTPISNNILDLWSQFQILRPGVLGYNSFSGFKSAFCNITKIPNEAGKDFEKITGYKAIDELKEAMARCSLIVKKERCLDLPSKLYEVRSIEMPPALRLQYDNFEMNFSLALEDGVAAKTEFIIVQMLKLSQMCCGFITADDSRGEEMSKVTRVLEGGDTKLKEMLDDVTEVVPTSKLIIWARFHHDIDSIARGCSERGIGFVTLDGRTKDRQANVDRFNNDPTCRVFVGNTAAGGVGLTLLGDQKNPHDCCKVTFFYSNGFSYGQRDQAEARNHRIGQGHSVLYRDYVYENTIEETIAKALQAKKDLAEDMKDVQSIKHLLQRKAV